MRTAKPGDYSLTAKVATLTHDVGMLSKTVDSLATSMRETTAALSDHITKLSDRITATEQSRGPTWPGIAQVASIIATYTVLVSALVALYVRGEIMASQVSEFDRRLEYARESSALKQRISTLEERDLFAQTTLH